MYCSHCGYHLSDKKIEKALSMDAFRTKDTVMTYVCPRCGKIIKENLNEEDTKALSRAAHAEIHRARNFINSGMCFLMISIILSCISGMFFLMSFKASEGGRLVTTSTEFYVFIAMLVIGICALAYSIFNLFRGITKRKRYTSLLKDVQNEVFVQ